MNQTEVSEKTDIPEVDTPVVEESRPRQRVYTGFEPVGTILPKVFLDIVKRARGEE